MIDWGNSLQPSEFSIVGFTLYGKSSSNNLYNVTDKMSDFTIEGTTAKLQMQSLLVYPLYLEIDDVIELMMTFRNVNGVS